MKYLVIALLSLQANAYELGAIEKALDNRFGQYTDFWGLNYSEANSSCDLVAEVLVSAKNKTYECSICLITDTNNFWDYSDIECDFAAH